MEGALYICSICSRPMIDSRMLPCSHSYCLKCLESSCDRTNSSKCPTCQIEFEIPIGGLKNLKKNKFIDKIVTLEHQRTIQTPTTEIARDAKKFKSCDEHLETMTLFCDDCKVALCGLCLTLNHKDHDFMHLSKYFDSKKLELEEHLKTKEEHLATAVKNLMNYEMVRSRNELKVSNLKEEIRQRGEDLKKAIEAIVDEQIAKVEEYLKAYQKSATIVTEELKTMIAVLTAEIDTLKLQSNSLDYKNISELKPTFYSHPVNAPTFSKEAIMMFFCSRNEQATNLKKMFGNVFNRETEDLACVSARLFYKTVRSFAINQDNIYISNWLEPEVLAVKREDFKVRTRRYNLEKWFSEIFDLLIIEDAMFISGLHRNFFLVGKVLLDFESRDDVEIIYCKGYPESCLSMSKTPSGDLLLNFNDRLVVLSTEGNFKNAIKLTFQVYDALESTSRSLIVCCQTGVCIVDSNGDRIASYLPINHSQRIQTPQFMAEDKYGIIHIYDYLTTTIFILDSNLNYVTSHCLKEQLQKLSYDEERNMLLALTIDNMLLELSL